MKIYSIDVEIAATMYVRAASPEEAMKEAKSICERSSLELMEDLAQEPPITGMEYNNGDLPDASLSPAMTIKGVYADQEPECVHED